MVQVFLGLGSNLGNRFENLRAMVDALERKAAVTRVSSVYETDPVGYLDQPKFLNAACLMETDLTPVEVLEMSKKVERAIGPRATFRNGPRYADLDILLYEDSIVQGRTLTIPHPGLEERPFVLVPLLEIGPDLVHPVSKRPLRDCLRCIEGPWGVVKVPELRLRDGDSLVAEVRREEIGD